MVDYLSTKHKENSWREFDLSKDLVHINFILTLCELFECLIPKTKPRFTINCTLCMQEVCIVFI